MITAKETQLFEKITNVCCIGAGYVGGPTSAILAEQCSDIIVTVVDSDFERIRCWREGPIPIQEPGLSDVISKTLNKNLFFSTDIIKSVQEAQLILVSVNTPTKTQGEGMGMAAEMAYFESAARMIVNACNLSEKMTRKIIVEKSTVPCRTASDLAIILRECRCELDIISSPEFLAEGTALNDLRFPDRVLIGGVHDTSSGKKAQQMLKELYSRWVPVDRILLTSVWSSELGKLAANAMLAQRISSINALSSLCELTGADIDEISTIVGTDSRLGPFFLKASLGFGGSCFRKDILSLVYISRTLGLTECANYWEAVVRMNEKQTSRFFSRILSSLFGTVNGKKIAVFGFAFKKNTGDCRETPALIIVQKLLEEGAKVAIYDPLVPGETILKLLSQNNGHENNSISHALICGSEYEAARDSHAIIICTEWERFKHLDYLSIFNSMIKPAFIFDGRLILDAEKLRAIGFNVKVIGKK